VFEDLLSFGHGLDLEQRPVRPDEIGQDPSALPVPVLAVLRDGAVLRYNDRAVSALTAGDALIYAATAS
jgi:voltage-gated potassium channel